MNSFFSKYILYNLRDFFPLLLCFLVKANLILEIFGFWRKTLLKKKKLQPSL